MNRRSSGEPGQDALIRLCDEIRATIASDNQSATLSELLMDPGAAICDGSGRVLACTSIRHLGAFSAVGRAWAAGWSFAVEPQSVVLLNDPFGGGTRVLDFYAVHPVELNAAGDRWIAASRCTAADLGGNCFGGYNPTATEVWAEGARITPLRVYEGGTWARETLACVTLNSRTPSLLASQLRATITAVTGAGAQLAELVSELGDEPSAIAAKCLDSSTALVTQTLPQGPRGRASEPAAVPVRSGEGEERGRVTVEAELRDDAVVLLDLRGSSAASSGYTNATRSTTVSAALAALFADDDGPAASESLLRAVEVITRPDTIVDAAYPAPTACGELSVAAAIRDAVAAAVSGAAPAETERDRGILGADGRLAETLAESLQADEARAAALANGGSPWR